jgi:hypothetical protein
MHILSVKLAPTSMKIDGELISGCRDTGFNNLWDKLKVIIRRVPERGI